MRKNIIDTLLFRIFVPIPYGTLVYLLLLMINNNLLIIDETFINAELYFCIALAFISLEFNRLLLKFVFNKNASSTVENFIQLGINAFLTLLVIYYSLMAYFVLFLGYESLSGFDTEVKSFALFFGITSLLYNMLSISYNLLNKRNVQLFDDEETLKEQIQYELESYQAQINPDLLLESLESAITLIRQDADKAEDFIDHLALAYRYILKNQNNESTTIENEVEAAKNLLFLHNVKHRGLIKLVNMVQGEEGNIIPGSIPLLIDEIVKINIISKARPLEIVLGKEDNYLTLSYKLNERLKKNSDELLTFERLHIAYSFYTDQPLVKVLAYGDAFYKIPLLNLTEVAA
jgi:histidine kinase